ncbi:hypothetical protein Nepgr_015839 [Nepenthes gracilis]|uniref:Uncharacterized protein n=1 Tax=Nepenthes gracilis TaxID=150966 RepID=A0AAD3SLP9_NEPGR|nr:hypothetical protein Nepgr_015839 [Nepenthes gracilis]
MGTRYPPVAFFVSLLLPYGKSRDYDANCIGFVEPWSRGFIYIAAACFQCTNVVIDRLAMPPVMLSYVLAPTSSSSIAQNKCNLHQSHDGLPKGQQRSNSKISSQLPANSSSKTTSEPQIAIGDYCPPEKYICHICRPAKANQATSANVQTGRNRGEDPKRRMGGTQTGILSAMSLT